MFLEYKCFPPFIYLFISLPSLIYHFDVFFSNCDRHQLCMYFSTAMLKLYHPVHKNLLIT